MPLLSASQISPLRLRALMRSRSSERVVEALLFSPNAAPLVPTLMAAVPAPFVDTAKPYDVAVVPAKLELVT